MNNAVNIDFVLDKKYPDPNVTIRAKEKTRLVDNIIQAVENVSEKSFLSIPAYKGDEIKLLSQRDILSAQSHEHKVIVQTDTDSFLVKKTLISLEEMLDPVRFLRISHSEIINLYKVKSFDLNIKGAIGIQFENGVKTWVARRYLKTIREFLK
ncbi:MAG: LytTR family transcriptional regulator DNA-binding domain-containing protein [Lachnospiraceae bacterium]|nr:LytTR family transcriptional regulator DNA-binding domain-containing protein [Lachnospiraceae bacterium]